MNVISDRTKIRSVAKRYRDWMAKPAGRDYGSEQIAGLLEALDPESATVNDVTEILGDDTKTWIGMPSCTECGNRDSPIVCFETSDGYDAVCLCHTCLTDAVTLVQKELEK